MGAFHAATQPPTARSLGVARGKSTSTVPLGADVDCHVAAATTAATRSFGLSG